MAEPSSRETDLEARVGAVLSEGDLVAGRVAYAGTHSGPLGPLAPTYERVTFQAIDIARFDGEQIAEW